MPLKNIPLSKVDFDAIKWWKVIEESDRKECHIYDSLFFAKAKEAGESGDEKAEEAYTLLGAVCSLHLRAEDKSEPFGPMFVMQTGRSAVVDDLTQEHLQALGEIFPDVQDPELKARIGDVLWIAKKDFRAAGFAVEAYLESAKAMEDPSQWFAGFERIERAFRLANQLGRRATFYGKVLIHIEALLNKYNGEDPLFFSAKLMELILEHRHGDPKKYSALSEKTARKAYAEGNFRRARTYWEIKARWDAIAKNIDAEKASKLAAAETYVAEAETADSALVASSHLQKAIEAIRRVGGQQQLAEEIHQKLLDVQSKVTDEMQHFSHEMDISEMVERHRQRVSGKTLQDALFDLCLMASSPKVAELRERVEGIAKNHPLQFLVSSVAVNEKGKVIGKKPNMMSDDPDEVERAMHVEMFFQTSQFDHNIVTQGLVEPVRWQILKEHNPRVCDFYPIVRNSPFVPPGRDEIYAQGLHAGLTGNYLAATHLLIPQVENSIRHILEYKGVTVSRVDEYGIQDERPLNSLLEEQVMVEVFGEDLVFDLRGLLVERFGSNLRNRVAHGLISQEGFYSVEVPYFWWLTLRIVCLPLIMHKLKQEERDSSNSHEAEG